ncbi:MAG: nucleotide exchange factor GrpE [Actinomycetota bacterium]
MSEKHNGSGEASASPEASSEVAESEVVQAEVVETEEPDELAQARAEAAARLDDARRIKAEFENYKKRVQRDLESLSRRGSESMIEKLLPVLDAFQLALIAADRTKDYDALVRGVELVYGEIRDVLHKEGLEEIESLGKPFDPEVHEAVMESEHGSADGDPHVSDVLRPGYRFKGRVLRPAMVKVERK